MSFRLTAPVAVVIAMALTGEPAVASTWLPSWLHGFVTGTEQSNEGMQASPARNIRRANRERSARAATDISDARAARVQSARCITSAAEVRKLHPGAWPKWTYGPHKQRCWYAGAKPVFARTPQRRTPLVRIARGPAFFAASQPAPVRAPRPASAPPVELDGRNTEPAPQPWALEYRWHEGLE